MALFTVPKRMGRDNDSIIVSKLSVPAKQSKIKSGQGIVGKISEIVAVVEKNLGKYRDDYIIINSEKELDEYVSRCIDNGVIAIDTETTGLDPLLDQLVGICIYTPGEKGAYIPINHVSYITGMPIPNQMPTNDIKYHFQRVSDAHTDVIMYNACFDIRFIKNHVGVTLKCKWDGYLASRLLNENEPARGLKKIHQKYCLDGVGDAFKFDDLFKGVTFNYIPIQTAYLYAAHDPVITYELYEYQRRFLDPKSAECVERGLLDLAWVFHNIEMPCVEVVADMEDNGIELDVKYASELSDKYNSLLEEKTKQFYELCNEYAETISVYRHNNPNNKLDEPINIGSSTQLAILFYDIIGIKPIDPKKPRGTGVEILEKIDIPIAKAILEYRAVSKLLSTYIDKLPGCVNPNDGRIHCKFNQYGADTGRFSSQDPNLQNIPSHNKDIRKMFKATDGYVLMSSDYSQQEPKVMTQMCGDPKMIQAYREGKDLYAEIAALSFNTTYENCLEFRPDGTTNPDGKERRSQAKSILLGVLYGRGVPSIAEQLGTTTEKAQAIKDSVFKGFPAIPKFEEESLDMAYSLGYVTTLWGRKRRLPDLQLPEYDFKWISGAPKSDDPLDFSEEVQAEVPDSIKEKYLRKLKRAWGYQKRAIFEEANEEDGVWIIDNGAKIADAERQCVNARIQGSAADMSKLAMIKVGTDSRLRELGFRLLIPVHDELIAECPIEHAEECKERFAKLMSEAAESKLTIPISCDVEVTERWYGDIIDL